MVIVGSRCRPNLKFENSKSKFFFTAFVKEMQLKAIAYKQGPNNGTSRKIDFANFLLIDWP